MTTWHAIDRPERYLPGADDNFVSNEVIVKGPTAAAVRTCVRYQAPAESVPGRLPWTARQDDEPEEQPDVLQAWLVEDLPGGRVLIPTQETQIGERAAALAQEHPNPRPNGHQPGSTDWSAPPPARQADHSTSYRT